jgi:hypothetical protein
MISVLAIVASLALVGPNVARANDAALAYGGTPRPLTAHPTVSMQSEYIKLTVGEVDTMVDCRFIFVNHGPACTVRMGFPDQGRGAADPDEEGKRNPPTGTFKTFESWVGGKKVNTTVTRADHPGNFWHEKEVAFPANGTVEVRDRYTVEVGNSVGYYPVEINETSYILHTGSSWHGNIGRSKIEVLFVRQHVKVPVIARRFDITNGKPSYLKTAGNNKHEVYYRGPCVPTVSGATLTFVRTNWHPTKEDDIDLVFETRRAQTTP